MSIYLAFFFSSRRRHTRCALVTGVQTCALPIFKPNTDDMRDSASLSIIPALQKAGCRIKAYDPEGMEEAARLLNDVEYCKDAYETLDGADCVAILTEWNEFRALDLEKVRGLMNRPVGRASCRARVCQYV